MRKSSLTLMVAWTLETSTCTFSFLHLTQAFDLCFSVLFLHIEKKGWLTDWLWGSLHLSFFQMDDWKFMGVQLTWESHGLVKGEVSYPGVNCCDNDNQKSGDHGVVEQILLPGPTCNSYEPICHCPCKSPSFCGEEATIENPPRESWWHHLW